MSDHRHRLVLLPANRVWRTYQGGRTLDSLAGHAAPRDSHFPEDWVGSVTRAVNPGRESIPEGVSSVRAGDENFDLRDLLARDPAYFLGPAHVARYGSDPRLLVKLLDSSIRLHFQVHPTADFARQFLQSPSGKTEAYHVLATRPEIAEPCIYLGFQRPPSRDTLRRLIETQDIAALEACFDPIPVKPGDTYLVPGGVPHALGAGVFLVEIQEPSDLVVRFEFERGGYVLPESARFMNRGLDFCLDIFDFSAWTPDRIASGAACPPSEIRPLGPGSREELLIGPARTPCFEVRRLVLHDPIIRDENLFRIGIVTGGACTLATDRESIRLPRFSKFLLPAGLGPVRILPEPDACILECRPPA